MNYPKPTLNKIPGSIMPVAQTDNKIKNLSKLSQIELLDLERREKQLLSNKARIAGLPDKGARIRVLYEKVQAELKRRAEIDKAETLFSNLRIADRGSLIINELEWRRGKDVSVADKNEDKLDSDDEQDLDPLRIIAQRRKNESRIKIIDNEKLEVNNEEINECDSSNSEIVNAKILEVDLSKKLDSLNLKLETTGGNESVPLQVEKHVQYLVEKTELLVEPAREKFKPYRTTINNSHDIRKENMSRSKKNWENTSATPPALKYKETQMISLMDSVEMQIQQMARLKILQEQQAEMRLVERKNALQDIELKPPNEESVRTNPAFSVYRNLQNVDFDLLTVEHDDLNDDSLDEVE